MRTLPTADWTAALDRMTVSLDQTLADLDRSRAVTSHVIDSHVKTSAQELLLEWLERRLAQWDERLNAAAELAASVETQLGDREAAVERWHDVLVRWKELIQRKISAANPVVRGDSCPETLP
jgi:hypothetical protein